MTRMSSYIPDLSVVISDRSQAVDLNPPDIKQFIKTSLLLHAWPMCDPKHMRYGLVIVLR